MFFIFKDLQISTANADLCPIEQKKTILKLLSSFLFCSIYFGNSVKVIMNGDCELKKIIFELTSNKHSNIVTSSPCFPMYDVFAKMVGSTLNQVKYVSVGGP